MSEYAVGGPIPADAPLVQLDNSYILTASQLRQLGDDYDPNLLKRLNAIPLEQSDDGQS